MASEDTRAVGDVELVRGAWAAFARGDLDAATSLLDPQVRWHGAREGEQEGGCHNREEVRAFIRQALADGVTAELLDVVQAGDASSPLFRPASRPSGASDPSRTAKWSLSATARSSRCWCIRR